MSSVRRGLASTLCVLLFLETLGPSAWGQAALRAASASAPAGVSAAAAAAVPALLRFSPPGLAPSAPGLASALAAPAPVPSLLPAVAAPVAPAAALARPVAAPARALALAVPSLRSSPAKAVPADGASGRVAALSESAARALENVSSAASSRADLRRSGDELEGILSGETQVRPSNGVSGFLEAGDSNLGAALRPAQASLEAPASEPAAPMPEIPAPARRGFLLYAGGISVVKVGIEALNLVVPALLLTQYGAASLVGALFLSSQLAGLVAGWVAGPLVDRFSPAKVLAVTAILQITAIGAIPLAFAFGTTLGLPAIFALFTVNGLLGGAFDIARRAALPQILGRDERVLNAHNAKIYIARELAAMAGIFGTGLLLDKLGYLATLGIHPAAYFIAALLFARLAFRRTEAAPAAAAGEPAPAKKRGSALAALKSLTRGARLVWSSPELRRSALLNIPVITLHNLFHQMLAVVYAAKVLGSPAAAAVLLGAWNLGEFAAALLLRRQAARRGENASSGKGWQRYAAAAVLGAWLLWLFPSVYVAAPVIFLMAMAMLGNELALASYFQSAASKEDVGAVTGFVYSLATTVGMAALLAMGWIFDGFGGTAGMLALAVALSAASVFFWMSSRRR
ncbi:MAG: MFS transporter [Elusimicrobiota bacterium]|nr:MFS transporter [Elusimicrobiota bacterium]